MIIYNPPLQVKGHTLIEVIISILVYSLLLGTMVAVLSIGLKAWQLSEVRTDTQQSAEIAIQRLTNELKVTHRDTCQFDPVPSSGDYYICFEAAVKDGTFQIEGVTRKPVWQAHIIYYVLPDSENVKKKILYRREIPHFTSVVPKFLDTVTLEGYLVEGDVSGNKPRVISRNVEKFEVYDGGGTLLCINLECSKSLEERKLSYKQDFKKDIKAKIQVSTSVSPRN